MSSTKKQYKIIFKEALLLVKRVSVNDTPHMGIMEGLEKDISQVSSR